MIHDEKTTELELPPKKKLDPTGPVASSVVVTDGVAPMVQHSRRDADRSDEFTWNSPWVLRLVAVLAILVLSMIIL